jgi:hypothetical protein
MNDINYNLKRHVELLKREEKVLSQNKSFFKKNRAECLELSKYSAAVSQHISWEDRFEVAWVIQAFLNKEMDNHEFHDSVFGLRRKHLAKCDKFLSKLVFEEIKDFSPTKESYKLKGFLSTIYFECEHFETNFDEDKLYISIGNEFLKLKKILNSNYM